MEWAVTFPGLLSMVPAARRFVRGCLHDCPRVDDAEVIVAELAGNALRHTASGDGGSFTLRVASKPCWARVEVSDQGCGRWNRALGPADDPESGRGLTIVDALADTFGHDATPQGQSLWADLSWRDDDEQ